MVTMVHRDIRFPLVQPGAVRHAAIPRGPALLSREVLHVLVAGNDAKVAAPAVQTVAVDVVNLDAISLRQSEQRAVQVDDLLSLSALQVAAGVPVAVQAPASLVDELSISSVNDGVSHDRAVSSAQGDQDDIIVVHHGYLRGVAPPAATNSAGVYACPNCTKNATSEACA